MEIFAERLRNLMDEQGLSQNQLSNAVNIARPSITKYLASQRVPDIKALARISEYFEVSQDYLTGVTNNRINENSGLTKEALAGLRRLNEEELAVICELLSSYDLQSVLYSSICLAKANAAMLARDASPQLPPSIEEKKELEQKRQALDVARGMWTKEASLGLERAALGVIWENFSKQDAEQIEQLAGAYASIVESAKQYRQKLGVEGDE